LSVGHAGNLGAAARLVKIGPSTDLDRAHEDPNRALGPVVDRKGVHGIEPMTLGDQPNVVSREKSSWGPRPQDSRNPPGLALIGRSEQEDPYDRGTVVVPENPERSVGYRGGAQPKPLLSPKTADNPPGTPPGRTIETHHRPNIAAALLSRPPNLGN